MLAGLSVDGDSQGVERLFGALSAHMWPVMILKSGDKISEPALPEQGFYSVNSSWLSEQAANCVLHKLYILY